MGIKKRIMYQNLKPSYEKGAFNYIKCHVNRECISKNYLNVRNKLKNLICNSAAIKTSNGGLINIIQYRHIRDVQVLLINLIKMILKYWPHYHNRILKTNMITFTSASLL